MILKTFGANMAQLIYLIHFVAGFALKLIPRIIFLNNTKKIFSYFKVITLVANAYRKLLLTYLLTGLQEMYRLGEGSL